MATTKLAQSSHPIVRSANFAVTADNDELLPVGDYIILGAYMTGLVTGLTLADGTTAIAFPGSVVNDSVVVLATGAGTVNLTWIDMHEEGYTTQST